MNTQGNTKPVNVGDFVQVNSQPFPFCGEVLAINGEWMEVEECGDSVTYQVPRNIGILL